MAKTIYLSDFGSDDGFIIQGGTAGDHAGFSVSAAGDVNGDGIADLILGLPGNDAGGLAAGAAYVIFGRDVAGGADAFATLDLAALSPSDGFFIQGYGPDDEYWGADVGFSVSGGGDINGDGIADLIVGAPDGNADGSDAGEAYVIFGRDVAGGAAAFGTIDLAALDPSDGFLILGADRYDYAGRSVSTAGDVNGDGIDDVLVGAHHAAGYAGAAYVVFGRDVAGGAAAFATLELVALDPADGFTIAAAAGGDFAGYAVSDAGDVNGDGIGDVLVASFYGDGGAVNSGIVYLLFGRDVAGGAPAFSDIDLALLDPADGFAINGEFSHQNLGSSVAAAGDVNGDGIDDFIVGAANAGPNERGGAFVIFGRDVAGGAPAFADIDLPALDPADGFVIQGEKRGDETGDSVSSAGDVNGDGIDDLIIGDHGDYYGTSGPGRAYVVFGRDVAGGADPFGTIDLSDLGLLDGFVIEGDALGDRAGWSVSAAGDVNGDGIDDLIVGAWGGDDGGGNAGEAYVIYGERIPEILGTALADTLTGTAADEVLRGLDGDDLIGAGPGDDLLLGGGGNDEMVGDDGADEMRGDAGDDTMDGGLGNDDLYGLGDDDLLDGRAGDDFLSGGLGADRLIGGAGNDRLRGGPGQDVLTGGGGNDVFIFAAAASTPAGAGDTVTDFESGDRIHLERIDADPSTGAVNDTFFWLADGAFTNSVRELRFETSGADLILQGDIDGDGVADLEITLTGVSTLARDDFAGTPLPLRILGDGTDNTLVGDIGADVLNGLGGDDLLDGGAGDDVLYGGAGNDEVRGGSGENILHGGTGDDTLIGGNHDDVLYGGAGNDSLDGARGADTLYGGSGDDLLTASKYGDKVLRGNSGNDTLVGYWGDDLLNGGVDDDVLYGNGGYDKLRGNAGDDTIYGGHDRDRISGNLGQDYLEGGGSKDKFVFRAVEHSRVGAGDTIGDFTTGDLIHLAHIDADATSAGSDEAFTWIADAAFTGTAGELRFAVTGADLVVQADVDGDGGADLEITLLGVTMLTEADFIL